MGLQNNQKEKNVMAKEAKETKLTAKGRKRGRKPVEVSELLMKKYATFRVWQKLITSNDNRIIQRANAWAQENGYAGFTDKAFCDKHNIERDYTVSTKKNTAFKSLYYDATMELEYENLPICMNLLLRKAPKDWLQNVYPEQTEQRTIQKIEVDTTEKKIDLGHLSFEELHILMYGKKPE